MIFPAWTDLGLLVALCGNVQADGWLERECTFYEVREDEGVVWVGLVWNGDGPSSPGELVQSLTIPVLTDGLAEWDKELSVTLVNPTGGAFLGTNATARITLVEFAPNPLLLEIIEHVQSADLMGLMRQITGGEPVVVGGDVRTIISRHTTSATLRQATQLVFERFKALGLEAGYQHWDVAQLKMTGCGKLSGSISRCRA